MPSIQKTFTLIPKAGTDAAGRSPTAVRPMTSKQVRKAYKAANRMPPMSKAERIKQERAEQERIRKELEKEKAAARAKIAREKKREKELAEREQKRKNGLPLVSVRPSQDTIARFVRGNGSGKKRDSGGQHVGDRGNTPIPVPVPPIQEEQEQDEEENPSDEEQRQAPNIALKRDTVSEADTPEMEILQDMHMTSENDDYSQPLQDKTIQVDSSDGSKSLQNDSQPKISQRLDLIPEEEHDERPLLGGTTAVNVKESLDLKSPKEILEPKLLPELDLIPEEDDFELEMLALDVITTPKLHLDEESEGEHPAKDDHQPLARKATVYETDLGLNPRSPREVSISESRPTKPPDWKPQMPSMPPPPPPRRRSPSPISAIAPQAQPPPLSTQAILFNFDDFFPTSSQQARELEEEMEAMTPKPSIPDAVPEPEAQHSEPKRSLSSSPTPSESPAQPKRFFTSSGTNEMLAVALLRSRRTAEREERQRQEMMRIETAELAKMKRLGEERKAQEERLAAQNRERAKASSPSYPQRPNDKPRYTPPMGTNKRAPPTAMRSAPPAEAKNRASPMGVNMRTPQTEKKRPPAMETNSRKYPPAEANKRTQLEPVRPPQVQVNKKTAQLDTVKPPPIQTNKKTPPTNMKNPSSSGAKHKPPSKEANKENIPPAENPFACPSASQETEYGGDWIDEAAMELIF